MRQISRWRTDDGWSLTRETEDRSILEDGFGARKVTVSKLATLGVDQLKRGIEHLARRHEAPSLQECERLSVIVANLDRIGRLDSGKATEHLAVSASVRMTAEDIRKAIVEDPFFVSERKDETD
jgi:hypothetical protein